MGQKVNPTGMRLGITEKWKSQWYADKNEFGDYLVEDEKIRRYIKRNYYYCGVSEIIIKRTRDEVAVRVYSARPGLMIGRKGVEVQRLTEELQELIGRTIEVTVEEVQRPDLNSQLVAEEVAQQIERRRPFRRSMQNIAERTMDAGAKGVRVELAGRLGGSDMTRHESILLGSIPLHTIRAKIDYAFTEAYTKYGHIGVKVWINHGYLMPGQTIEDEQEESDNGSNA
jgi:small subunit ribosomal protein S3